jgi:chromosome segregation ATPase
VDDRLTWRKERAALEQEIKALKKDGEVKARKVEEAGKEAELFRSLRGENERLRYGWAVMAGEYGDLYESFQANERDLSRTTRSFDSERHILEIRVDSLEHLLSDTMEERDEARQHLALISAQRDLLSDMTEELLSSRPERHEEIARPLHEEILPLGPLIDSSDAAQLLDLSIGHNALIGEHLSDLEPHILSLTASIMTLEENLRSTTSTLASLQATHGRLEAEHAQNRLEHASCGVTISQLRYDADSASQMTAVREEELAEARIDLRKSEERIQKHADLLAQATENEARSKFALESLEEEIVQ